MNPEKNANVREMIANYLAIARKAARYWPRALLLFVLVLAGGMTWVVKKPRMFKSEASATVYDIGSNAENGISADEAQAALRARLDQIYGSRANLGHVVDELHLYPWLHGRTSHLKIIESFQDAITYTAAGRDAFHLEFVYQDPAAAQHVIQRLLRLYTDERRAAGQVQIRNELASAQTALGGLETVLSDQEDRLERFERANHEMVEQVRLQRLGQLQVRPGGSNPLAVAIAPDAVTLQPGDTANTHRLRIRLAGLQARYAALQRALTAPALQPATPAAPAEESEHLQTLRHTVSDLRDRLARLRTTYTDEYPDVQVTLRRLADAERDLTVAIAAEHPHAHPVAATSVSSDQARAQIDSVVRDIEQTRGALAAAVREDRQRAPAATAAPSPPAPVAVAPTPSRGHSRNEHARAAHAPATTMPSHATATPSTAATAPTAPATASAPPAFDAVDRPLGSLIEVESTWDRLMAELSTTRTRYQQLLTRQFELEAQLETVNTTGADVLRVIDPPTLPAEPEPPGRTRLAAIVLAVALAVALGIAGLSGFLDSRVYEPADLRRWGELPELPAIPDLRQFRRRRGGAMPEDTAQAHG